MRNNLSACEDFSLKSTMIYRKIRLKHCGFSVDSKWSQAVTFVFEQMAAEKKTTSHNHHHNVDAFSDKIQILKPAKPLQRFLSLIMPVHLQEALTAFVLNIFANYVFIFASASSKSDTSTKAKGDVWPSVLTLCYLIHLSEKHDFCLLKFGSELFWSKCFSRYF